MIELQELQHMLRPFPNCKRTLLLGAHRACLIGSLVIATQASLLGTAQADTLLIPLGSQAPELQSTTRPAKGLSTEEVIQIFGKPLKQTPAVGDPPISRWTFDDFVVYFESDKVIHTVLKHRKPTPQPEDGPGPELTPAFE